MPEYGKGVVYTVLLLLLFNVVDYNLITMVFIFGVFCILKHSKRQKYSYFLIKKKISLDLNNSIRGVVGHIDNSNCPLHNHF